MKAILLLVVFAALVSAQQCDVGDIKCMGCKTVIGSIEKLVASNKTEEIVINVVEKLCDYLPDSFEPVCDRVVEVGIPRIMEWLANKIEPEKICQRLRLCPADNSTLSYEALVNVIEDSAISFAYEPEMTPELFKNKLMDICESVPNEDHAKKCKAIVGRMNGVMYIQSAKMNPRRDGLDFCDLCKDLMDLMVDWIKDNANDALADKVTKFCNKLGSTLQPICTKVIKSAYDKFRDQIVNKIDSEQVCVAIQAC